MNKHSLDVAMVLCYNLAILAGTTYLVQFYDWSPWWFLLTVCCLLSFKTKEN
jgi:hypothetical protein